MRNIDLIRQVISASENNWPHVLGCLNINVPDSPRRHAPCPACGGKDRFRFDDNGRGSFICNQCGAGDGLDLIKRVNNCDTTEAALLAADVLGIDYRTTETPEATSQKREQLETERQRREQERLKRAEKDEQQRRDTFSRQFDDMRRKAVNGKSDYLVAKGVGDFTFPVLPDGSLLLALVDKSGAVTAAQTITSHGEKRLLTGSAKRGAYHAINAPETTQSILIAEGLATALSAHLIRPEALTVAAIDAGNLLYVAQVLRDKFPSAQIIIAADNDHSEGRQNTGRIAAEKAALSVSGWVALPPTDHKADWNDYHQKHGIKCATEAFNKSMYQPQGNGVKQEPQTIEGSDFKVMDTDPLKPRIESREDGIYWVSPRADSQSGEIINNESWLCSPLSVIGTGRDDKDQYLILRWLSKAVRFHDYQNGKQHADALKDAYQNLVSAEATGGLGSTATSNQLSSIAPMLYNNWLSGQMQNYGNLLNVGMNAASGQATAGQNYANNTGQLLQGLGAIRAGQAQQPSSLARGIGGAASGALAGAQLGSVVPGIGNVAGAIGGGLIGLVGGLGF
ncbi:toprim domain-containing protein [Escherichia coli]|nr:toprim domain-containing protein [Escherichia coli]